MRGTMGKIFDSHSHYNDKAFQEDYPQILQKIQQAGVDRVINVGADLESSRLALKQKTILCTAASEYTRRQPARRWTIL